MLMLLCACMCVRVFRPFHVEPRNIVDDAQQERVSAEAAILNSRVHYYSRLTGSSDRLLVLNITIQMIVAPLVLTQIDRMLHPSQH